MYQKPLLHLVLALFFSSVLSIRAHAQTFIQGKVLSAKDSTAIYGASVYLDGTSYGVSAGENGEFYLPLENSSFAALIISSMGYETMVIDIQVTGLSKTLVIYLRESLEFLDEVYLADDTWSRSIKLGVFRREFLGNTPAALKCKIFNEDALRLRYNPQNQTLTVHATEPLIILNNHLGYQITYNLQDFIVQFKSGTSGLHLVQIVYFEGHSFFSEINKTPSRRHLRNREDAFKGSTLHFMRSLADKKLHENGYRIFKKSSQIPPYASFGIARSGDETQITLLENKLNILFNNKEQSSMEDRGPFSIDRLGNHFPPQNVMFGGAIGTKRIAEMVPLNYKL